MKLFGKTKALELVPIQMPIERRAVKRRRRDTDGWYFTKDATGLIRIARANGESVAVGQRAERFLEIARDRDFDPTAPSAKTARRYGISESALSLVRGIFYRGLHLQEPVGVGQRPAAEEKPAPAPAPVSIEREVNKRLAAALRAVADLLDEA